MGEGRKHPSRSRSIRTVAGGLVSAIWKFLPHPGTVWGVVVVTNVVVGLLSSILALIFFCHDVGPCKFVCERAEVCKQTTVTATSTLITTPTPSPSPSPTPVPPQLGSPSLVARNGFLHLVWQEESGQDAGIYYARAQVTDESPIFSKPVKVNESGVASSPDLAVDSTGRVHVAYAVSDKEDTLVYYSQSDDGLSFGPQIRVANSGRDGGQTGPAIAVSDAGEVHIAWVDAGDRGAVYYARLETEKSFGAELMVNDPQAIGDKEHVDIALDPDGGIAYVVWADKRTGDWLIYSSRSVNKAPFSGDVLVSSGSFPAQHPSIAVGMDGAVHTAWQEKIAFGGQGPVYHTFYGRAAPGGTLFPTSHRASDNLSASLEAANPSVAVDGDEIAHVVFETFSYRDGGFVRHDKFSGDAFGSDVSVTDGVKLTSTRREPSVAIDEEDVIHAVWVDERDGPRGIFYARSTDGGASFSPNTKVAGLHETDTASTTASEWEVEVYSTRRDDFLFGSQTGANRTYYMPGEDSVFLQVTFGLRSATGVGGTLDVRDVTVTDNGERFFPVGLSRSGAGWLVGTFSGTVTMAPAQPGQAEVAFEVASSSEYSSEGQRVTGTTEASAGADGLPLLSFVYVVPSDASDMRLEVSGGVPVALPEPDTQ